MKHVLCIAALAIAASANAQVLYTQNFDSMGTAGTTAPTGWKEYSLAGTHDTFSFAGSLPSITTTFLPNSTTTAITGGTYNATLIAATPTNQRSAQGFNFGLASSPTDRALGTSPTGIAASILEYTYTNTTGASINSLAVAYDIRRFSTTAVNNSGYQGPAVGLEELPGYWFFYSLDNGATWTNVSALNPTINGAGGTIAVPNTVGVTNVPTTVFSLASSLNAGSNILFRWVDDNAQSPSPDQLLGLDNVVISLPTPGAVALAGLAALAGLRRRR